MPCFSISASACTIARNSPMLLVPLIGPKWKILAPVCRSTHWYSIGPGLPEQPASTAQLFALTSMGKGNTVSFLYVGGFTKSNVVIVNVLALQQVLRRFAEPVNYILSGTSIPSRAIAFLMVFATLAAMHRRTCFCSSVSALRIEKS